MKTLVFVLALFTLASCDPYHFGFKKNPAFVLDATFTAISNLDNVGLVELTGKEALCVYGNQAGVTYLRERLTLNPENIKFIPKVLETRHFSSAKFVGYWSYYRERYQVNIHDKTTGEYLLQTIVDCDYGTENEQSEKLVNQKPSKYKKKECRLVKIVPQTFASLPVPTVCDNLRVVL